MHPYHIKKQDSCESCHYWDDYGDEEDATPRTGGCCRYPPQYTEAVGDTEPMHLSWAYPATGGHWWCGEYRPATTT